MPTLTRRFDWVGFDPRGVGASTPAVDCIDSAALDRMRELDLDPESPAERSEIERFAQGFIEGCRARTGPALLSHLGSVYVARDMDLLREALGEEQLNFFGISYGTWLGAVYATLFPTRVRAFVLDSAAYETGDRRERSRRRAVAFESSLNRFLAWCAATASCGFHRDTQGATAQAFDALLSRLDTTPLRLGDGRTLGPGNVFPAVVLGLRAHRWPSLADGLGSADMGFEAALMALSDADRGRSTDGAYTNATEAFAAISFSDSSFPEGFTRADYEGFVTRELTPLAPRMGRWASILEFVAVDWPFRAPGAPFALGAPSAPALLIVGGLHDPATPYELAVRMRDDLANASHLLSYEGEGHAQVQQSACIRSEVSRFLIDPSVAPSQSRCPAQ